MYTLTAELARWYWRLTLIVNLLHIWYLCLFFLILFYFRIEWNMSKHFCYACGHPTLNRTTVLIDDAGNVKPLLSRHFQMNLRGTKVKTWNFYKNDASNYLSSCMIQYLEHHTNHIFSLWYIFLICVMITILVFRTIHQKRHSPHNQTHSFWRRQELPNCPSNFWKGENLHLCTYF